MRFNYNPPKLVKNRSFGGLSLDYISIIRQSYICKKWDRISKWRRLHKIKLSKDPSNKHKYSFQSVVTVVAEKVKKDSPWLILDGKIIIEEEGSDKEITAQLQPNDDGEIPDALIHTTGSEIGWNQSPVLFPSIRHLDISIIHYVLNLDGLMFISYNGADNY